MEALKLERGKRYLLIMPFMDEKKLSELKQKLQQHTGAIVADTMMNDRVTNVFFIEAIEL